MTTGRRVRLLAGVTCCAWACMAAGSAAQIDAWTQSPCAVAPNAGAHDPVKVSAGLMPDGSALVRAAAGDLELSKTVAASGHLSVHLRGGDDIVRIDVTRDAVSIARGAETLQLALGSAGEDEVLAASRMLAGSRAVRALRLLAAGIGSVDERTPPGMALVLTDALVGLLAGDVSAVHRLADRVTHKRAAIRLVRAEEGCYEKWEAEVIRAWNDYEACMAVRPDIKIWRDACGLRWLLWAESAWFAFLKCVGSPFIQ